MKRLKPDVYVQQIIWHIMQLHRAHHWGGIDNEIASIIDRIEHVSNDVLVAYMRTNFATKHFLSEYDALVEAAHAEITRRENRERADKLTRGLRK